MREIRMHCVLFIFNFSNLFVTYISSYFFGCYPVNWWSLNFIGRILVGTQNLIECFDWCLCMCLKCIKVKNWKKILNKFTVKHKRNPKNGMHMENEKWGQNISASLNIWHDTFYFQKKIQSRNKWINKNYRENSKLLI